MSEHDNPLSHNQLNRLTNELDRIKPYLELSGEWTVHDLPDRADRHGVYTLKREGAICQVERDIYEPGGELLNKWKWKPNAKQALKNRLEQRETLPCGHRIHVTHHPEKDCLTCKECRQDGTLPEYEKDMVKELL